MATAEWSGPVRGGGGPKGPAKPRVVGGRDGGPTPWPVACRDVRTRRIELVRFSAEDLRAILDERNVRNRPITRAQVEFLKAEMGEGRWRSLTFQPVKFDWDGFLQDGQHRLTAASELGEDVDLEAAFGLDPEDFQVQDRCKPRSLADDLHHDGESSSRNLASAVAMAIPMDAGRHKVADHPPKVSLATVRQYLADNPDFRDSMNWPKQWKGYRILRHRLGTYAYFRLRRVDREYADRFFEDLVTGSNMTPGDPLLSVRNQLTDRRPGRVVGLTNSKTLALVFKAWNYRRSGRKVEHLVWRQGGLGSEPFPEPI